MAIPSALHSHCEPQRWKCPSQKSFTGHSSWVLVWAPCTRVLWGGGWGGGSSLYTVSSSAPARHHPSTSYPSHNTPTRLLSRELGGFTCYSWDLIWERVEKGQILG